MEESSSSWSRSRSSWLPIREIKTNRRCTLCNCCTICTISKVTHSAKTNTILAESQLQSQSHSQSQFLSWRQQLQLQLVMFTAYHDSFPTPVTPSPISHLPSTLYFLFHLVFSMFFCSPSSRCIFLSLVTSALSCHSCSSCRLRVRVRVWVRAWVQSPQAAALVVLLKSPMISHKFFNFVRY